MAITNEVKQYLTGGAGNSNPNASLGGAKSSTEIVDNTDNNMFADVTGDEGAAGSVKYRCRCVHNNHATLSLLAPKVWIPSNTGSTADIIEIGLGSSGVSTGSEQTVANEDAAPTGGVTFSNPTSKGTGLSPGDVPAGSHFFIWERRTVTAGAGAHNANAYTIEVQGDSAA